MSVRPAKTQLSLGIRPVFAVRMKKAWVLSYPLSAQRRLWSDWFCHVVAQLWFFLASTSITGPTAQKYIDNQQTPIKYSRSQQYRAVWPESPQFHTKFLSHITRKPFFGNLLAGNAPVTCNHGPHGAGDSGDIAGLKCHILTSASSPQCGGTAGLLIPCQTYRGNFLFTCRDLNRALTIDMSPQSWAYTRALQRQKSISPLFPGPTGAVVTNDWCIRLKPAFSASETSYSLGILFLASIRIILSQQRTTKALIRLGGCAG